MRFHKLRIAWTVFFGLATALLIELWAGSYHTPLHLAGPIWVSRSFEVTTAQGCMLATQFPNEEDFDGKWRLEAIGGSEEVAITSLVDENRGYIGFGFIDLKSALNPPTIIVPFWFTVALVGIVSALPWIRRYQRFSLRTLLIATTLLAVALGLAVYLARK